MKQLLLVCLIIFALVIAYFEFGSFGNFFNALTFNSEANIGSKTPGKDLAKYVERNIIEVETAVAIMLFVDLIIAFVNIIGGFKEGAPSMIVGGALCGLIALGISPAIMEPHWGVFFGQVGGMVLGLSTFIIGGLRFMD